VINTRKSDKIRENNTTQKYNTPNMEIQQFLFSRPPPPPTDRRFRVICRKQHNTEIQLTKYGNSSISLLPPTAPTTAEI
jgi:hypothetical protein